MTKKTKKKRLNDLTVSEDDVFVVKGQKLSKLMVRMLKTLYDGTEQIQVSGEINLWRRVNNPGLNYLSINGLSEFNLYPYSVFIDNVIPMEEREIISNNGTTIVAISESSQATISRTLHRLWERGLVEVFNHKVEITEKGNRRMHHEYKSFKDNHGRAGRVFALTLSVEGLLLCRKRFDGEEFDYDNVIFE